MCMLEADESGFCCEVLEVPEAIRCALHCMLEAVESALWLLDVLEVMRCVLLVCWRPWMVCSACWR